MQHKKELLDILAERTGCTYLSDLRQSTYRKKALAMMKQLHRRDYPASEWGAALAYLQQTD